MASKHERQSAASRPGRGRIRPGGRTEQVRRAVVNAVFQLFEAGRSNFSAGDVAQLAAVDRTTVHRRWPTRGELVREALNEHGNKIKIPDTGRFDEDVRQLSRELRKFFSDPIELGMNAAMASHADPELNRWIIDYWTELTAKLAEPVRRAIERGEVDAAVDPVVVVNMLMSPMLMWTVYTRTAISTAAEKRIVDHVLRLARGRHR